MEGSTCAFISLRIVPLIAAISVAEWTHNAISLEFAIVPGICNNPGANTGKVALESIAVCAWKNKKLLLFPARTRVKEKALGL